MALNLHELRVIRNIVMRDGLRAEHPRATPGPIVQMNQVELAWIDAQIILLEIEILKSSNTYGKFSKR